jgi:hypothetical protein
MLVASFTLVPAPPAGATRVARIHVQIMEKKPDPLRVNLVAAADPAGRRIGAIVRLVPEEGERQ